MQHHLLSPDEQLADLALRAGRAAADTARNRQSGSREQYMASYCLWESLDGQLARLLRDRPAQLPGPGAFPLG